MRERPMLFSSPMVRALLDGRKTQTRRVVKAPSEAAPIDDYRWTYDQILANIACPHGVPGDRLWVKETFVYRSKHERYYYRADHPKYDPYAHNGWSPSSHMPRAASRITLEIVSVRVERLHEISEDDAMAEGLTQCGDRGWHAGDEAACWDSAHGAFRSLWESINGPGSWAANPFCWRIEFEVLKP